MKPEETGIVGRDRQEDQTFSTLSEPFWSLAMALSWIIWRTEPAVRENYYGCTDISGVRLVYEFGVAEQFPPSLPPALLDPNALYLVSRLIAHSCQLFAGTKIDASAFSTPVAIPFEKALSDLRKRLLSGELIAEGLHGFSIRLSRLLDDDEMPPREPAATDRKAIPASAWIDLILEENPEFYGHPHDIAHRDSPSVPRYRSVTVAGSEALRLWPPLEAGRSSANKPSGNSQLEDECKKWLSTIFAASPEKRLRNNVDLRREAKVKWPNLDGRQFDRAKADAVNATGAQAWRSAGRPPKNLIAAPK